MAAHKTELALNCFDHVFVINADNQPERFKMVALNLSLIGIEAERFPAVIHSDKGHFLTAGQRGCAESHLNVVKLSKTRGYGNVLILEDDVIFRANFFYYWNKVCAIVKKTDYDLFYFYRWRNAGFNPEAISVVPIEETLCAHAYAVSSRYFQEYISIFESDLDLGNGRPADRKFTNKNARLYGLTYNLIGQNSGVSTIDGRRKPKRFEHRFSIENK